MNIESLHIFTQTPLVQTAVPAVVAMLLVFWIYFKVLKIAKDKNIVDLPKARKFQFLPIPVLGGVAVFFGVVGGLLTACMLFDCCVLLPVLLGMSIMVYIGAMDDIIGLTPVTRLVIEMLVALCLIISTGYCVDSFHGLWGIHNFSWWYAIPLTIFACVGIINAMNMIDGVNGLSSGICLTCSALFGSVFLRCGDIPNAVLALTMAAALFPFLLHNVFGDSSRMFIGDAGTMMMGVLMSWFTIRMLSASPSIDNPEMGNIALVLAILAVPVFDALRVMTMRAVKGISPFRADKTHLHHAFVKVGISHSITALSEILLDLLIVLCWWLAYRLGASPDVQLYVVLIASIIFVWGNYFLLWLGTRDNAFAHRLQRFAPKTHLGHTRWWIFFRDRLDCHEINNDKISEV